MIQKYFIWSCVTPKARNSTLLKSYEKRDLQNLDIPSKNTIFVCFWVRRFYVSIFIAGRLYSRNLLTLTIKLCKKENIYKAATFIILVNLLIATVPARHGLISSSRIFLETPPKFFLSLNNICYPKIMEDHDIFYLRNYQ